jgi:hypothetical protein
MARIKLGFWSLLALMVLFVIACEDADDFNNVIEQISCSDGIQNGEETGVDCGAPCPICLDGLDFSGVFIQQDIAGRPGINTVFNNAGPLQDAFNRSTVSARGTQDFIDGSNNLTFPGVFHENIDQYFVGYTIDEMSVFFGSNILGFDLAGFAEFLATTDALQLAAEGTTTYRNTELWFTGRKLTDDVMDTTLLLLFGGPQGDRFDGVNGPMLISDGVGLGDRVFSSDFPYLEAPLTE